MVLNKENIIEIFEKAGKKLDKLPIPQKNMFFYWKGKWRKLNKRNTEEFLRECQLKP